MGNGASVNSSRIPIENVMVCREDFNVLEKRCKARYFWDHEEDFRLIVESAIKQNALDILEVLIPSGNVKKIFPLHVASAFARLDSVELLISAGFNPLEFNFDGQLPIHQCCTNRSAESILVATFLCLINSRALKQRDKDGMTALHIAVKRKNQPIVKVLISYGADPSCTDYSGKTPLSLAKELQLEDLVRELSPKPKQSKQSIAASEVNQERIMQIWERFFENAMKSCWNEITEDEVLDYSLSVQQTAQKAIPSAFVKGKETSTSSFSHTNSKDKTSNLRRQQREVEWFEWVLLYSSIEQEYFVIHRTTRESRWLNDHLKEFSTSFPSLVSRKSRGGGLCDEDLPVTTTAAVQSGWIMFLDQNTNECTWMNIFTGDSQYYLPIGEDRSSHSLPVEHLDVTWVYPQMDTDMRGVVVYCEVDDNMNKNVTTKSSTGWDDWVSYSDTTSNCYYYHCFAGISQWEEPSCWQAEVDQGEGYMLCATEDLSSYYWYCPDTGESHWC